MYLPPTGPGKVCSTHTVTAADAVQPGAQRHSESCVCVWGGDAQCILPHAGQWQLVQWGGGACRAVYTCSVRTWALFMGGLLTGGS
jgi:hypothetical protein